MACGSRRAVPHNGTGTRKRQWEEEMLSEYLAKRHGGARVLYRVRLGPHVGPAQQQQLTPEEQRLLGAAWRRWADAVLVEDGTLWVIEAALIPTPGDIAMVELYLLLVPTTPELQNFAKLPRRGMLLWAVDDPYCRQVAVGRGYRVELFKPAHFTEWARLQEARKTRAVREPAPVVAQL